MPRDKSPKPPVVIPPKVFSAILQARTARTAREQADLSTPYFIIGGSK